MAGSGNLDILRQYDILSRQYDILSSQYEDLNKQHETLVNSFLPLIPVSNVVPDFLRWRKESPMHGDATLIDDVDKDDRTISDGALSLLTKRRITVFCCQGKEKYDVFVSDDVMMMCMFIVDDSACKEAMHKMRARQRPVYLERLQHGQLRGVEDSHRVALFGAPRRRSRSRHREAHFVHAAAANFFRIGVGRVGRVGLVMFPYRRGLPECLPN